MLYDHLKTKKTNLVIEQGQYMDVPSPSRITVELDLMDGQIQSVLVGGLGKVMKSIQLSLQ
ncbi:MAG: hypothetical protein HWE30_00370 [Methylocystaceae bacterium]|nr:hypothetical protein [Methylocystaceae bacterium]